MFRHICAQCAWEVWTISSFFARSLVCSMRCAKSWEQIRALGGQRVGHAGRAGANMTWSTRDAGIFLPGELQTRLNDVRYCVQCASRLCGPLSLDSLYVPTCSTACLAAWKKTNVLLGATVSTVDRSERSIIFSSKKGTLRISAVYKCGTHAIGTEGCGICADEV